MRNDCECEEMRHAPVDVRNGKKGELVEGRIGNGGVTCRMGRSLVVCTKGIGFFCFLPNGGGDLESAKRRLQGVTLYLDCPRRSK